jgi:hypothetical protein
MSETPDPRPQRPPHPLDALRRGGGPPDTPEGFADWRLLQTMRFLHVRVHSSAALSVATNAEGCRCLTVPIRGPVAGTMRFTTPITEGDGEAQRRLPVTVMATVALHKPGEPVVDQG